MIEIDKLSSLDRSNMFSVLENFPNQVQETLYIAKEMQLFPVVPKNILILGMGGSAIGGDFVRSYLQSVDGLQGINIQINRSYSIPKFVDSSWGIIASSYSGNTEETLTCLTAALEITQNIVCITTGGKLEQIAKDNKLSLVNIPDGLQPRCAIGYSFFSILMLIAKTYNIDATNKQLALDINEALNLLQKGSVIYSQIDENNPAYRLASKLKGKIPTVYSSSELTDVVNLRWRGQFQENAKNLAFGGFLPEANHNDICGWVMPDDLQYRFVILFITDELDNTRVKLRFSALRTIYESLGKEVHEFSGKGKSLLARTMDLIYFGDWASYYLAMMNEQDPTPIPLIAQLKKHLEAESFHGF